MDSEPIRFRETPPEAKKISVPALDELNASTVVVVEDDYMRAEFVSNSFRFVDDVECHFPPSDATESIVHLRTALRVGFSDFGVNRKRMETIRSKTKAFNQE